VNDELFDAAAVEDGAWWPGPYGPGDQLGTYREVGQDRLVAALALLDPSRPLRTFDLGCRMFDGFPAFGTRTFRSRLAVGGTEPGGSFDGEVLNPRPRGPNRLTSLEELVTMTFNMGAKVNGLAHVGVGDALYGGHRLSEMAAVNGKGVLDATTWGPPLMTRGLLIDVVALKEDQGDGSALTSTADGVAILDGSYRITVEDLEQAAARQSLPSPEPGDAVLIRTGWSRLIAGEPDRFISGSPGVWLRETRWLGERRPALVATDSWMWGSGNPEVTGRAPAACHQELMVHFGIRLGEGFNLEDLAAASVDRFLFCHNPLRAEGAVSSNAPATALANVEA
jgi:kynurenine formamidase